MARLVFLGLLLLSLVLKASLFTAPRSVEAQIDPAVRDRVIPAAVEIAIRVRWREDDFTWEVPLPVGSGTIISPTGLILSNQHVVDRSGLIQLVDEWSQELAKEAPNVDLELIEDDFLILVSDGTHTPEQKYVARVVREDSRLDLALLRIVGDSTGSAEAIRGESFPFVPLGDSDSVGLGDQIRVFSYPSIGGGALTYTEGAVSGFLQESGVSGVAWITTDAVMSGGSSGGTAINDDGNLIGIPTQGAELDCRPGDTNRDGVMDVADIGCIPTGGSLGQLRPINLAQALLEAEEPQLSEDLNASTLDTVPGQTVAQDLDLPRLALNPQDLEQQAMEGFLINMGQLTTARGVPAFLGIADSWSTEFDQAGLQEVYWLENVQVSVEGLPATYVQTTIWSYADEPGAAAGFDLSERKIEGIIWLTDDRVQVGIGDEAELSQWRYTDVLTQTEMAAVEMTFRAGNMVASVRKTGVIGTEHGLANEVRILANVLLERLTEAERKPVSQIPLSDRVIRLVDASQYGAAYYLSMPSGEALPSLWHDGSSNTEAWTVYWRRIGVENAFEYALGLPVGALELQTRLGIKIYQFRDDTLASAFVDNYDGELRSLGTTDLQEQLGTPTLGDQSRTFTFQSDWWPEEEPELRATTLIRTGGIVAIVEGMSTREDPHAIVEFIAAEQFQCMEEGCAARTFQIPEDLGAGESMLQVTPSPLPSAAIVPTSTPMPTAIPLPTPTSIPAAWGFIESFDANTGIMPRENENSAVTLNDGRLTLTIKAVDGLDGFIYDAMPSEGRNFGFAVALGSTSGWGEINLRLGTVDGDVEWFFAIDPITQEWFLHRTSSYTQQLFYWVEPRSYAALAPGPLQTIEVQIRNGQALLLINGVDVVTPTGISMPAMSGSLAVGFGAGINPYSLSGNGDTFSVEFEQVRLYELP